ncbi:response regulator [Chloroflexales bacterium ZM16-3]|nr:response regulator [Chloroflexales bacterium ZM16-3]
MVIDDEPLIGQLLRYQLGDAGYTVEAYQSASEALARFAYAQPDLVLLDVMMPEISGYDLCREIRTFSQVPVIMLTAKHADEDMVAGLTIGADDYIGKPFSAPQLIARVEAVLRRSGHTPTLRPARPRPAPPARQDMATPQPIPSRPRLGAQLSAARHDRGLSLHDASHACGVRWEFLQAIEQEQFSYVPRPDLRAALRSYSDLLDVDLRPYMRPRVSRKSMRESIALVAALTLLVILSLALLMI